MGLDTAGGSGDLQAFTTLFGAGPSFLVRVFLGGLVRDFGCSSEDEVD